MCPVTVCDFCHKDLKTRDKVKWGPPSLCIHQKVSILLLQLREKQRKQIATSGSGSPCEVHTHPQKGTSTLYVKPRKSLLSQLVTSGGYRHRTVWDHKHRMMWSRRIRWRMKPTTLMGKCSPWHFRLLSVVSLVLAAATHPLPLTASGRGSWKTGREWGLFEIWWITASLCPFLSFSNSQDTKRNSVWMRTSNCDSPLTADYTQKEECAGGHVSAHQLSSRKKDPPSKGS